MTITNRPTALAVVRSGSSKTKRKPAFRTPPLPKGLDASLAGDWKAIIRHLHDRGVWHDTKCSLLEAYLQAVWTGRLAHDHLTVEGHVTPEGKPNPWTVIASKASVQITNLAKSLAIDVDRRSLTAFSPVDERAKAAEDKAAAKSARWTVE